jgi:replicative DNA helicase
MSQQNDYSPEPTLGQIIEKKFQYDIQRDPDVPKGYSLQNFPELTKAIDGIQPGFYVIGSETNVGKTALLINVLLDVLDSNSDIRVLYFSLDDSISKILNRLYANISGIELMEIDKRQSENSYFIINEEKIPAAELQRQAVEKILQLYHNKRLDILGNCDIKAIRKVIEESLAINKKMVIFLDGLNYLDIGNFGGLEREERLAGTIKQIVARHDIPIITTAEVRKDPATKYRDDRSKERRLTLSDISGSKRLIYLADTVLLLEPENEYDFFDPGQRDPILKVSFAKNKLSYFRGSIQLRFIKYKARMVEVMAVRESVQHDYEAEEDFTEYRGSRRSI